MEKSCINKKKRLPWLQTLIILCIMKIDFYICRHGQTDKNVEGVWQGSGIDAVLNETGRQQAAELACKLRFKMLDVYSSPLLRAVQTANAIASNGVTTREFVIMQDLRECYFGEAEGLSFEETKQKYGEEFINGLLWPTDETADLCFPNGESKRKVFERVYSCLNKIVSRHTFDYAYHTVCIVCHAGIISALQFGFGLKDVSCENCGVLHLQYDTNMRKFVQCFD